MSCRAQQADDVIGGFGHSDARRFERFLLAFRGATISGDDRPGVTHPLALGSRAPRDESHGLQPAAFGEKLRRALFIAAADLADHNEMRGLRVVLEHLDDFAKRQAENRIAADPDDGGLAHARGGERGTHLIGEGAAARHESNMAGAGNSLRDDADLRHAWGYQTRTVGSEKAGLRVTAKEILDPDHDLDRDAFGYANDELEPAGGRLHDGVGRKRRWHEDARSVGVGGPHGIGHRVEDW